MSKSARSLSSKSLSVILAILLIVSAVPFAGISVLAASGTEGLEFGDVIFEYTIPATTLGEEDTVVSDTLYAVTGYTGKDSIVNVPATANGKVVEYVGDYAFSGTDIDSVYLPDTIRGIGNGAFLGCLSLDRVVIGSNADANILGSFTGYNAILHEKPTVIGSSAFANCTSLRHFAVYTSQTSLSMPLAPSNAFAGCSYLKFYGWGTTNVVQSYYYNYFLGRTGCSYINLAEVEAKVFGVSVSPESAFMAAGEKLTLTVSALPFTNNFLYNIFSYSSSDENVAIVGDDGVVKAVGNGTALITVTSINGFSAQCEITVAERVEGNYAYRFLDDGTVEIARFNSAVTGSVVIPEKIAGRKVTSIGAYAFSGCSSITSVTLPDSITDIGIGAFQNCTGLALFNVSSSSKLTSIGNTAFYGCTSLAFVNIACGLKIIGDAAFRDCTSLAAVILPSTVTILGKNAFLGDVSLSVFSVKGSALSMRLTETYFSSAASLTIYGAAATSLAAYAQNKGIRFDSSVDSVTDIDWNIEKSELLVGEYEDVSVDAVLTGSTISNYSEVAFTTDNTDVINVDGKTITAVGKGTANIYAVTPCGMVSSVTVTVEYGVSGDYIYKLIDKMRAAEIIAYTNTSSASATVPDTVLFGDTDVPVTSIAAGAFTGSSVKTISIGENITAINGAAFDSAYALESIFVALNNKHYSDIDGILFNDTKSSIVKYPAAKDGDIYQIPSGVLTVGDYCFKDNKYLTYIFFSAKLTKIGAYSFASMESYVGAVLPSTVSSIGAFAFAYDSGLKYVRIPKATSAIGVSAFAGSPVTIYGYSGYYAEDYAEENKIPYKNASELVEVSELRLSASSVSLNIKDTYKLAVTVYPASASYPLYSFESADPSVATVSADGIISAVAVGDTEIIVKSSRGIKSVCTVTVSDDTPVNPVGVTSIRIAITPDKTVYENGEALDFTGAAIYAVCSDGSEIKIIDNGTIAPGVRIRNYDPYKAGSQTMDIIYGEVVANLTVTVLERKITAVTVSGAPSKLEYVEGTEIDTTGLVLTVSYNNGQTEDITEGYTVSPLPSKLGSNTITVTYEGFTDTFIVNVVEKSLVSISITAPTKTEYSEGSDIDLTGFTATGTYDNGTTEPLSPDDFVFMGYNPYGIGSQKITAVYFIDDDTAISCSFYVTVVARKLTGIQIVKQPDKQVYTLGERLDITGMEVVALFDNGTREVAQFKYKFEFNQQLNSLGETYFTIECVDPVTGESFTDKFKVLVEIGNYNNEFSYKVINDNEIEIIEFFDTVTGDYTIPEAVNGMKVTVIDKFAFKNNDSITSVKIPGTVKTLGTSIFEGCDRLKSVEFGNGITAIPDKAFFGCEALTNVRIPSSVTKIGDYAFARCPALTGITIPDSVTVISSNAFDYSNNVVISGSKNSYAIEYAQNAGIKFKEISLLAGDVDGDGTVTVDDARLALRAAVNLEKLTNEEIACADLDSSGGVSVEDARDILRYAVGLQK